MSHENANTSSLTDSEHLSAPTITYVEAGQTNELVSLDELFEGLFPRDARPPPLPLRALFPFLFARQRTLLRRPCRCCRKGQRKPLTAYARRQCRQELAEFDALPIVRRARAAGLHGRALFAYVEGVERLDGPGALRE